MSYSEIDGRNIVFCTIYSNIAVDDRVQICMVVMYSREGSTSLGN